MSRCLLAVLLAALGGPALQAQTPFDSGSTEALGDFANPPTVSVTVGATTQDCVYNLLRIDLITGKVLVQPFRNTGNGGCVSTALQEFDPALFFQPIPPSTTPITVPAGFPTGVLDFHNFTLIKPFGGSADPGSFNLTVDFVPNLNNTPVIIRASGNVDIGGGVFLNVSGQSGARNFALLRGQGGVGGPGGYRGGDGGNGGQSPTKGSDGFGPGGGVGGNVDAHSTTGAKSLTTGTSIAGVTIAAGNDLMTTLRGGSGGGGGGGRSTSSQEGGQAGGGGGGAILIAANGTIIISGTILANGGANGAGGGGFVGTGGSGGVVRLVADTIAGGGALSAVPGCSSCQVGSSNGVVRLEAVNITYSGTTASNVQAASVPGQVVIATTGTAFIQFVKLTASNNASNFVSVDSALQATPGRTGSLGLIDVRMPNPTGPPPTVTVDLIAGPNPGFPNGKAIKLVVTPADSGGGGAVAYSGTVNCPGTGDCTAAISNVVLPLGASSLSAFVVLDLKADGTIARMFPSMYEGEPIESVRMETTGKDTQYVLISQSGREFPYLPGR
ncbi:MAG: hypothetical protein HY649_04150 [Acidobacteria bacterium]|nr:hypothetical protein [Acidobacteriota bacterium]